MSTVTMCVSRSDVSRYVDGLPARVAVRSLRSEFSLGFRQRELSIVYFIPLRNADHSNFWSPTELFQTQLSCLNHGRVLIDWRPMIGSAGGGAGSHKTETPSVVYEVYSEL